MSGQVVPLPDGCLGFDANCVIDAEGARAWYERGFRFVYRYVRRDQTHRFDLSRDELQMLHDAGLGVVIVQHVAPEGWHPTAVKGSVYGNVAAEACTALDVPASVTVFCDLEGVAADASHADVVAYCQEWHRAVRASGAQPGLYVGWACGLSGDSLYHELSFARYWSAYNAAPTVPSIRGYCLRQHPLPNAERPVGYCGLDGIDRDVVQRDKLGGLPTAWAPDGWAP